MPYWGPTDARRSFAFRKRHGLCLGLGVSILLHAVPILLIARLDVRPAARKPVVPLQIVSRPPRPHTTTEKMSGQVVDIPPPAREEAPPEDARFLSRYNTRVEREQRARTRTAKPGSRGESPRVRAHRPPSEGGTVASRTPYPVEPPGLRREDGTGTRPATPRLQGREALLRRGDSKFGSGFGNSFGLSVGWGLGFSGEGNGGGESDDAFLGVDREGDTTLVNSRSFKYWDFFQRVKERVREEWDPATVYRARDPTGTAYGARDRITVLAAVLDAEGRLQRVEVVRESGLPFLDEEALRAFREAAPFLNPPEGLADEKGRIAFHFGFILDLTSSRSRCFWQRQ